MKNVKKLVSALVAVSMIGVSLLAGCSTKEVAAKDVASALYKLALQGEDKEAKEIGFTDAEIKTLKDKQKSTSVMNYRKTFLSAGMSVTQSDAESLYNAEMEALKKLTFSVEVKDEKGKNCNVVIKTDTIDVSGAVAKATQTTTDRVKKEKITSTQKAGKILLEEFKKELAAIEPTKEQQQITTAFVLEKVKTKDGNVKMWIPKDSTKFGSDLAQTVEK